MVHHVLISMFRTQRPPQTKPREVLRRQRCQSMRVCAWRGAAKKIREQEKSRPKPKTVGGALLPTRYSDSSTVNRMTHSRIVFPSPRVKHCNFIIKNGQAEEIGKLKKQITL